MASKPLLKQGYYRRFWTKDGKLSPRQEIDQKRLNSNANKVVPVTIEEMLNLRDRLYGSLYDPAFDLIWRLTDERDYLRKQLHKAIKTVKRNHERA